MAKQVNSIEGFNAVFKKLNKAIEKAKIKGVAGLIKVAANIRRDMDTKSPKIPVDFGNLRASYYVVANTGATPSVGSSSFSGEDAGELSSDHSSVTARAESAVQGKEPLVMFGFSAAHAWWVHENLGVHFKRDGAGAKFMSAHVNTAADKMLTELRKGMKL